MNRLLAKWAWVHRFSVFLLNVGVWLLGVWAVMIILGNAHMDDPRIPNLGFVSVVRLMTIAMVPGAIQLVWKRTRATRGQSDLDLIRSLINDDK